MIRPPGESPSLAETGLRAELWEQRGDGRRPSSFPEREEAVSIPPPPPAARDRVRRSVMGARNARSGTEREPSLHRRLRTCEQIEQGLTGPGADLAENDHASGAGLQQAQHTGRAEDVLRRGPMWAAPLLWRSELRNSLVGLVRRHVLDLDKAARIASDAERLLAGSEYSVPSGSVLQLALRSGCSAYDREFVALALDLDRPPGPEGVPGYRGVSRGLRGQKDRRRPPSSRLTPAPGQPRGCPGAGAVSPPYRINPISCAGK